MADDIRLVIGVEKKGVLSAITATENLEKKVKKLSDTYARDGITSSQYADGIAQIAKAAKVSQADLFSLGKALRKADKESKKAAASVKAEAKAIKAYSLARRQANEEDRRRDAVVKSNIAALNQQRVAYQANTKELTRIRMATDSVFAAEQKLLNLKKLLRTEVANGNMTMRQAAAAQMQYKKSLNGLSGSLIQGRNKMNSMSVVTQQAGYQMGDFIVQVQGGQSAFIAFSQQATQMVGFLPLMAKQLGITTGVAVGLSAALGIGIPLLASLAMVLWKTKSAAEGGAEGIKTYADQVKEARAEIEKTKLEIAALNAGFRDTKEYVLSKGIDEATEAFEAAVKARDELLSPKKPLEIVRPEGYENILGGSRSKPNRGTQLQRDAEIASQRIANERAAEAVEFAEKEVKAREEVLRLLLEKRKASEDINRGKAVDKAILENQAKAEAALFEANADYAAKSLEARKSINEELSVSNKSLQEVITLKGIEAAYGEDSAEYLAQTQEYERQALETRIQSEKISSDLAIRLRDALAYAQGIAQLEMASGIDAAAASAMNLAKNFGIAYNAAYRLSLLQNASAKTAGIAGGFSGFGSTQGGMVGNNTLGFGNTTDPNRPTPITDISGFGSGTKGGAGGSKEDPRIAAQKAIDSLISSYDEEYAAMLKIKDAQDQVDKAMQLGILSTEKGKLIMDEYTKSVENAKNPMLDLANTMSSALGDALMSIVDGTKSASDAFKDMARIIIKQAFEMAVINPILNSIFGGVSGFTKLPSLLGSANGNVFSGGSHVQAYANGGVVGGPTMFPMTGGKTGLMGEAGPEAIMPLKRGANGKLGVQMEGGGQSVVVNQSFNFQANGDDSVKRLIAQAAPKIAQMTKSSMLDDRRRGGSTKAAFG